MFLSYSLHFKPSKALVFDRDLPFSSRYLPFFNCFSDDMDFGECKHAEMQLTIVLKVLLFSRQQKKAIDSSHIKKLTERKSSTHITHIKMSYLTWTLELMQ
jgi:hypothetical protein